MLAFFRERRTIAARIHSFANAGLGISAIAALRSELMGAGASATDADQLVHQAMRFVDDSTVARPELKQSLLMFAKPVGSVQIEVRSYGLAAHSCGMLCVALTG